MTDLELEALLDDAESDRVERKESANDGDKLRQGKTIAKRTNLKLH